MSALFPGSWLPAESAWHSNTFTTTHAITAGMTKRQVAYRLRTGLWVRVAGDALRHRHEPPTPQMLAHAANLTWPDAVVCGPSVVTLLGAPLRPASTVHVIAPTRARPRLHLTPHDLPLMSKDLQKWGGITITRPTRSYLDALVLLPPDQAQELFVWAFTRNRLTTDDFENQLAEAPRRWGNARLRRFLADARAGVMSPAEALTQRILRDAGIGGWTANVPVMDRDGIIARVDILFAAERIVVEIDGRRFHGADRFQSDRTRQNRLVGAGYTVLRFTWADLTQRPHTLVTQLRALLASKRG